MKVEQDYALNGATGYYHVYTIAWTLRGGYFMVEMGIHDWNVEKEHVQEVLKRQHEYILYLAKCE